MYKKFYKKKTLYKNIFFLNLKFFFRHKTSHPFRRRSQFLCSYFRKKEMGDLFSNTVLETLSIS